MTWDPLWDEKVLAYLLKDQVEELNTALKGKSLTVAKIYSRLIIEKATKILAGIDEHSRLICKSCLRHSLEGERAWNEIIGYEGFTWEI